MTNCTSKMSYRNECNKNRPLWKSLYNLLTVYIRTVSDIVHISDTGHLEVQIFILWQLTFFLINTELPITRLKNLKMTTHLL